MFMWLLNFFLGGNTVCMDTVQPLQGVIDMGEF